MREARRGGLGTSARYRFSSENRNSSCRIDCSSASIVRRCSSGHDSIPLAEACAECQALFGASTPAAKLLIGNLSPLMLSALLYLGAAIALSACRFLAVESREAQITRRDLPPICGIIFFGGMLGPILMLLGLQRLSALTGSLLLNLEGPFTDRCRSDAGASRQT